MNDEANFYSLLLELAEAMRVYDECHNKAMFPDLRADALAAARRVATRVAGADGQMAAERDTT